MAQRLSALADGEMDARQREIVSMFISNGKTENVFRTLAHYPELLKRWSSLIGHVLVKNSLPLRDREILILRIGYLARAEYEWAQHIEIARKAGFTDADFTAIMKGVGLSASEDLLLHTADELWHRAKIADETWKKLSGKYSMRQMLDIVVTVGQYNLVSMVLNSLDIELEDDIGEYPPLPAQQEMKP
jgi:alkylhydroperoxidase family enzyme